MQYTFLKDIGGRAEQQDSVSIFTLEKQIFMVVADGMGGHKGGAVASSTLLKIAENSFLFHNNSINSSPKEFFNKIIEETKEALREKSYAQNIDPNTTVIFALIVKNTLYYAYIGDSRLYLFEKKKKLLFRTRDHSLPEMLFKNGEIREQEIATHPQQNVLTKAIGGDSLDIAEYGEIKLNPYKEYRILLASDGLWAMIKDEELYNELFSEKDIEIATKKLLNVAKYRGGKKGDNISIATLSIEKKSLKELYSFLAFLLVFALIFSLFSFNKASSLNDTNDTNASQTHKTEKIPATLSWETG
jgi:serine/threonine protein phosphatase PrpC